MPPGPFGGSTSIRGAIKIPRPADVCDLSQVIPAAEAAHGVFGSGTRHTMVYMPAQNCGGWLGVAWINGNQILINGAPYIDVTAHELGHNFGLGHSNQLDCGDVTWRSDPLWNCTIWEYWDEADVMGYYSWGAADPGNRARPLPLTFRPGYQLTVLTP